MEMREFVNIINENLQENMGDSVVIKVADITKNNSTTLTGLIISTPECNVAPTIYLNSYYDKYEKGLASIDEITNDIIYVYNRSKTNCSFNTNNFINFEKVKDKVIFKLISLERNKPLLEDIPYIPYLDFAIVFQVLVNDFDLDDNSTGTILIKKQHIDMWKVTTRNLYELALINTPKLQPCEVKSMKEIIIELEIGKSNLTEEEIKAIMQETDDFVPMYVASNKKRINGASCILYPELLQDFAAAANSDFFVLPSSIHECIFIPARDDMKIHELLYMVKGVNETEVDQEEILNDSVYLFRKDKNQLEKVA